MEEKETEMPNNDKQNSDETPNELGGFHFEGHIKIFDPENNEIFIDKGTLYTTKI